MAPADYVTSISFPLGSCPHLLQQLPGGQIRVAQQPPRHDCHDPRARAATEPVAAAP